MTVSASQQNVNAIQHPADMVLIDWKWGSCIDTVHYHHHLSLTARVIGAPQIISQPVSSISPCSPLPSGTWRTRGVSIPWCGLPTSSSVCLVFFPPFTVPCKMVLARPARWFWPDLRNGKHDHTIAVCVSLHWSGGLRVVRLPAGSWHGLPSC